MSTSRRPSFADVAAISAGDPAALEDVFGRLWPEVYAFVRMNTAEWLGRKESHADLAQSACREVLEDLRARPKSFANEAEFRSWLFTAARSKVAGRARDWRAARRDPAREAAGPADATSIGALYAAAASPSAEAAAKEELERFERAFATLDESERELVVFRRLCGFSYADIATRRGVSEVAARKALSRATAKLLLRMDAGN